MVYQIKGEVAAETGFGFPKHTTAEREAYTPPSAGYVVWDKDLEFLFYWNGTEWNPLKSEDIPFDSFTFKEVLPTADVWTHTASVEGEYHVLYYFKNLFKGEAHITAGTTTGGNDLIDDSGARSDRENWCKRHTLTLTEDDITNFNIVPDADIIYENATIFIGPKNIIDVIEIFCTLDIPRGWRTVINNDPSGTIDDGISETLYHLTNSTSANFDLYSTPYRDGDIIKFVREWVEDTPAYIKLTGDDVDLGAFTLFFAGRADNDGEFEQDIDTVKIPPGSCATFHRITATNWQVSIEEKVDICEINHFINNVRDYKLLISKEHRAVNITVSRNNAFATFENVVNGTTPGDGVVSFPGGANENYNYRANTVETVKNIGDHYLVNVPRLGDFSRVALSLSENVSDKAEANGFIRIIAANNGRSIFDADRNVVYSDGGNGGEFSILRTGYGFEITINGRHVYSSPKQLINFTPTSSNDSLNIEKDPDGKVDITFPRIVRSKKYQTVISEDTLVFRQNYAQGANPFNTFDEVLGINNNSSDPSTEDKYSILGNISSDLWLDGIFKFKLVYGSGFEIEWSQTSNPISLPMNVVTGFNLINSNVAVPSFGGLSRANAAGPSANAWLQGQPGSTNWWFSIAMRTPPFGAENGMPAVFGATPDVENIAELYVTDTSPVITVFETEDGVLYYKDPFSGEIENVTSIPNTWVECKTEAKNVEYDETNNNVALGTDVQVALDNLEDRLFEVESEEDVDTSDIVKQLRKWTAGSTINTIKELVTESNELGIPLASVNDSASNTWEIITSTKSVPTTLGQHKVRIVWALDPNSTTRGVLRLSRPSVTVDVLFDPVSGEVIERNPNQTASVTRSLGNGLQETIITYGVIRTDFTNWTLFGAYGPLNSSNPLSSQVGSLLIAELDLDYQGETEERPISRHVIKFDAQNSTGQPAADGRFLFQTVSTLESSNRIVDNGDSTFTVKAGFYPVKIIADLQTTTIAGQPTTRVKYIHDVSKPAGTRLPHSLDGRFGQIDFQTPAQAVIPAGKEVTIDVRSTSSSGNQQTILGSTLTFTELYEVPLTHPLYEKILSTFPTDVSIDIIPLLDGLGEGVLLQDVGTSNSFMNGASFNISDPTHTIRVLIKKETNNKVILFDIRDPANNLGRFTFNPTNGNGSFSGALAAGSSEITDLGIMWEVIITYTTTANGNYRYVWLPDFGAGEDSNTIYALDTFYEKAAVSVLPKRISAAETGVKPGIYDLNSLAGGFTVELTDEVGEWIFHNTNLSCSTNFVNLGSSNAAHTFTDSTGNQVAGNLTLNDGGRVVHIIKTDSGNDYRVSVASTL